MLWPRHLRRYFKRYQLGRLLMYKQERQQRLQEMSARKAARVQAETPEERQHAGFKR